MREGRAVAQSSSKPRRFVAALAALLAFSLFAALGTWQIARRAWKLDLIARVDARVHAPAVDAPGPAQWPRVNAADDEYRHVRVSGNFIDGSQTFVQASTELGAGFWVVAPLRTADGSIVLVNRGFVPAEQRPHVTPGGAATITGLVRISEPGGAFLRRNDAAADRWYSRDVTAIAAARGLVHVAPYFIDADADAAPHADGAPTGGLTVIAFPNNHLVYAITWYTLALMVAGASWNAMREERDAEQD